MEYPSGVHGKARIVGYVLQSSSADRTSPQVYRGVSSSPVHRAFVPGSLGAGLGVRGPGIGGIECSVSRISCSVEVVKPSNLILSVSYH